MTIYETGKWAATPTVDVDAYVTTHLNQGVILTFGF